METVPNTSGLEIQANIMLHYYVDFVFWEFAALHQIAFLFC